MSCLILEEDFQTDSNDTNNSNLGFREHKMMELIMKNSNDLWEYGFTIGINMFKNENDVEAFAVKLAEDTVCDALSHACCWLVSVLLWEIQ